VFRKFVYHGIELDKLLDMSHAEVVALFRSNIRRRFRRGLSRCVFGRVHCLCDGWKIVDVLASWFRVLQQAQSAVEASAQERALVLRAVSTLPLIPHVILVCTRLQKREAGEGERPAPVKTHLRNMIIIPEMIGSIIGVYNGKVFMPVEVKVWFVIFAVKFAWKSGFCSGDAA
jgi:ribosomal protein S19